MLFDNSVAVRVALTRSNTGGKLFGKPAGEFTSLRGGKAAVVGVAVSFESLHEPFERKDRYSLSQYQQPQAQVRGVLGVVAERDLASVGGLASEDRINAAKLLRACGGCLGARRR